MAILIQSTTEASEKDRWATQWECLADARRLFGRDFEIDVCAEPETSKCDAFICHGDWLDSHRGNFNLKQGQKITGWDALQTNWLDNWWCNPPFTQKLKFIAQARKQQANGLQGMMLLPYEPLTAWWRNNLAEDVIIYEPDGRYNFMEVDGVTKKSGANFGSVLVAFPAMKIGPSIRVPFNRA